MWKNLIKLRANPEIFKICTHTSTTSRIKCVNASRINHKKFLSTLSNNIHKQYLHHSIFILQIDFSPSRHKRYSKSGNSKRKRNKNFHFKVSQIPFLIIVTFQKRTNLLLKNFLFSISYQLEIKFNGMELYRTLKIFFLTLYPSMGSYASIDFQKKFKWAPL